MNYPTAFAIATAIRNQLKPHCFRCEIAGSIRRKKQDNIKDIEIVAIPKPYDASPMFASGIALVVNQLQKVKGTLPCKYTQRILPGNVKLDLFFATPDNWGLIFAMRTGSAEYSHKVLATAWVKAGYHSADGNLITRGHKIAVPEEEDLFRLIHLPFVPPEKRNL